MACSKRVEAEWQEWLLFSSFFVKHLLACQTVFQVFKFTAACKHSCRNTHPTKSSTTTLFKTLQKLPPNPNIKEEILQIDHTFALILHWLISPKWVLLWSLPNPNKKLCSKNWSCSMSFHPILLYNPPWSYQAYPSGIGRISSNLTRWRPWRHTKEAGQFQVTQPDAMWSNQFCLELGVDYHISSYFKNHQDKICKYGPIHL